MMSARSRMMLLYRSPPTNRTGSSMRLQGTHYAIAATAAALCLLPACSSETVRLEATTTTTTTTSTTTQKTTAAATTTAVQTTTEAAAACSSAPPDVVAVITASFADPTLALGNAYAVSAPNGVLYIGGHIMRGDERESSADVWAEKDGITYALSGSAREYSKILPDGRETLNASAGDDYGSAVQECVIAG